MDVDLEINRVTLHLLFLGPGIATIWPRLQPGPVAHPLDHEVTVFHADGDRMLVIRRVMPETEPLQGLTARLQAMLVPGRPRSGAMERLLLRTVDGVLFLPSAKPEDAARNEQALARTVELMDEAGRSPREVAFAIGGQPSSALLAPARPGWVPRLISGAIESLDDLAVCMEQLAAELVDRVREGVDLQVSQAGAASVAGSPEFSRGRSAPETPRWERYLVPVLVVGAALAGLVVGLLAKA